MRMPRIKIKKDHKHVLEKNIAKKALAAAREIENLPEPTEKDIVAVYKDALEEARRLQKLLKPEWFVKDIDKPKTKRRKK